MKKCFEVFEEGLANCSHVSAVCEEYLKFILRRAARTSQPKYVEKALFLMGKHAALLTRELMLERIRLTQDVTLAKEAAVRFPQDLEVWSLYLAMECSRAKSKFHVSSLSVLGLGPMRSSRPR